MRRPRSNTQCAGLVEQGRERRPEDRPIEATGGRSRSASFSSGGARLAEQRGALGRGQRDDDGIPVDPLAVSEDDRVPLERRPRDCAAAPSRRHRRAPGRRRRRGARPSGAAGRSRSLASRGPSMAVWTVKTPSGRARLVRGEVQRRPDEDVPEAVDRCPRASRGAAGGRRTLSSSWASGSRRPSRRTTRPIDEALAEPTGDGSEGAPAAPGPSRATRPPRRSRAGSGAPA